MDLRSRNALDRAKDGRADLFGIRRRCFFELFDDFEHPIAADDRIVHNEPQGRHILEDHRPGDESLNAIAMAREQREAALLLLRTSKDADEDAGGMEVARYVHIIDSDEAGIADLELAADGLADLALEQFPDALKP